MPELGSRKVAPPQQMLAFEDTNNQEVCDMVAAAAKICGAKYATIAHLYDQKQYNSHNFGFELDVIPSHESILYKLQQRDDLVIVENIANIPRLYPVSLTDESTPICFYAGIPLQNTDGKVNGYLCIYHDAPTKITNVQRTLLRTLAQQLVTLSENKEVTLKIEDKINQPEEHLIRRESLFSSTKMVTLLLDKNFAVLKCHPFLMKLICDNLQLEIKVGDDIRNYLGDLTKADFVNNFNRALEGQSISMQTNSGICWGGVNCYCHFSPAYNLDGELIGVSYHALPIFPESNDEHVSARDDRQLQWFNDLQSHRFRGPVSSILGITQIWKELGSVPRDEEIDMIIQAANKLDREIQSVLFDLGKDQ